MEGCPAVRVDVVDIGVAVLNDRLKCLRLLLFITQHCFVDGRFSENRHAVVDLIAAIDQVPQVLRVRLRRCFIQILNDTARKLILTDLEWVLRESS